MSLWWVVPQYFMIGVSTVLAEIGLEEFFYDQVPDAMRSVGLALSLSAMGAGSYASNVLVSVIDWVRGDSPCDVKKDRNDLGALSESRELVL